MKNLKGKFSRTITRINHIRLESKNGLILSIIKYIKLRILRNFVFTEYHDCELDKLSKKYEKSFLNNYEQKKYLSILNPRKYYITARNKYFTHVMLESLGITKKAILYCYYNPELSIATNRNAFDLLTVLNVLEKKQVLNCVIKTTESSHGDNVYLIDRIVYNEDDADLFKFDGECIKLSAILQNEPLIFESVIKQTKQISNFNPTSVNTIRFMTTLHPNGDAKIVATFMKIGRKGCCVDNAGGGGNVNTAIDIETGKCFNTIQFDGFRNVKKITRHPDTTCLIEGIQIENWSYIKDQVLKFQKAFPFVKAAGWDIAITDDGPIVVEVNDYWDRTGQLFIQRGWKKEIKECYEQWNNIKIK